MCNRPDRRASIEHGSTLIYVMIALTFVAGLALALGSHAVSSSREARALEERMRAEAVAEAAIAEARSILETQGLYALQYVSYPRTLRGATYAVHATDGDTDATLDAGLVRLTAYATVGSETTGSDIVLRLAPPSLGGGLFAKSKVHLETESKVDAYDSRLGTYAAQAVNTHDGDAYADGDAEVGTNADLETKTDSKVFGDVKLGPTGWHIDDGSGYISGTVTQRATDRVLPPITVPSVASAGKLELSGTGTTMTIGPGTFGYDEIAVATEAELTIVGPATIVCGSSKTETDGKIFLDTSGGPIDYYCTGVFQVKTGTPWATLDGKPEGATVYLPSVGDSHKIETGATFTGTIYAPDGEIVIQTTGDVFGAVIADLITMKTRAFVHLDKALGAVSSGVPTWELVSVNRISGAAAKEIVDAAP